MKFAIALSVVAGSAYARGSVDTSVLDYQYMQYCALFNKHAHDMHEYDKRMLEFGKT